jgi:hypothetical protein
MTQVYCSRTDCVHLTRGGDCEQDVIGFDMGDKDGCYCDNYTKRKVAKPEERDCIDI